MSYESHLDSELKLAGLELEPGERERLSAIFKIIDEQGHSGGSLMILLPHLQHKLATISDREVMEVESGPLLFNADDFSEGLAKPVFQALNGLTLERALVVGECALKALNFTPFSPLTGDDSEWFEIWSDTLQSRRMPSVFKDVKTGVASWLNSACVYYPASYLMSTRYVGNTRSGTISFPYDPTTRTTEYHYTSESLRHHVVTDRDPNKAYLTQAMLVAAAGGTSTDTQLRPELELIDPTTAETLIVTFTDFWAALGESEDLANCEHFLYSAHRTALNNLRWASEYEVCSGQPETVTVFGVTFPYGFIPHLMRLVSFLPECCKVVDGHLAHAYDNNLTGKFVAVPAFAISPDSCAWVERPGVVSIVWNDRLVTTSSVYLADNGWGVDVICGDVDSWLWDYRERNHIDHPNRDTVGSRTVRCIDDEPSNQSVGK